MHMLQKLIVTDMNWSEKITMGKFLMGISNKHIRHVILDTGDKEKEKAGFLVNPPLWQFDGHWVLIPRAGDGQFQEIGEYIACKLENPSCPLTP